jgi:hypothetical protein
MDDQELISSLNNYGYECKLANKFLVAKQVFKAALVIDPSHSLVWANLGAVLNDLNEIEESERILRHSVELDPFSVSAHSNLALVLSNQRKWDEAFEHFNKALLIKPDDTRVLWDKAVSLLDSGNWKQGFAEYDIRFTHAEKDYPKNPFPQWKGEDLSGKTLFVNAEQGLGDRILFSRFMYQVKQKYPTCRIIFLTEHILHPLLWEFVSEGIIEYIPIGVPFIESDYHVYLMSIPGIMGCTPDNVPPDPGLIRKRCLPFKQFCNLRTLRDNSIRVGICWAGSPTQAIDYVRSLPFELMLDLIDNPDITFYSLQVGKQSKDIQEWGAEKIIGDLGEMIIKEGFTRTAITILNMDLIITVDTSVCHLAGALGVPVWTMLTYSPYWIWGREGNTTPWYPSMRLFRQQTPGDWQTVLKNVKAELPKFIEDKKNTINIYDHFNDFSYEVNQIY